MWDWGDLNLYAKEEKEEKVESKWCIHDWVYTGASPVTGEIWEDCSKCGAKKEDVDKK